MTTDTINPQTEAWLASAENHKDTVAALAEYLDTDAEVFGYVVAGLVSDIDRLHRLANISLTDVKDHLFGVIKDAGAARAILPRNGLGIIDEAFITLGLLIAAASDLLGTLPAEVLR